MSPWFAFLIGAIGPNSPGPYAGPGSSLVLLRLLALANEFANRLARGLARFTRFAGFARFAGFVLAALPFAFPLVFLFLLFL